MPGSLRRLRLPAAAAVAAIAAGGVALWLAERSLGPRRAAVVAIFAATYVVIAIGKFPGLYLDRAGAALLGASLMIAAGVLPLDAALHAIDFDTVAL
ncbi:MAG: hypothetical protein ACREFH_10370, partial [Stellaceae bacterium]